MTAFVQAATSTVLMGRNIPAHDETFDLAQAIGEKLNEFHEYIASVRDGEQADAAVTELLSNLLKAHDTSAVTGTADHKFRVAHEYANKPVYEGTSYIEASIAQTNANVSERSENRPPLYRMWLVDIDGISCRVNTQVE